MNFKAKTTITFLADILLLAVVVLLPAYLREGVIPFNTYYALFFPAWIFLSFIFGKYRFEHRRVGHEIVAILLNAFAVWGLLSLFVISFEMYHKSYDSLFLQILFVVGIEIISRIIYYLANRKRYGKGKFSYFRHLHLRNNQWGLMFLNLLWVFLAFMFLIWLKPATLRIYLPTFYPFLIGLLIWEFIVNLFTGKHRLAEKERFRDFLLPIIRANVFTFFLLAILVYLFHLFDYSRLIVFGTVVLSTVIESCFALYISLHSKVARNMDESESILAVTSSDTKEARADAIEPARYPDLPANEESVLPLLERFLAERYPRLFTLLKKHINIMGIRERECRILDTQTVFNIENIPAGSQKLLINLHRVNDFKRINDYFTLLNEKIEPGGYLVSSGETIKGVYTQFLKRYPCPFGRLFYFLHFLFRRVLPKFPVTREINYFLTGGQNRTLSKTEILGRLVHAGFRIIETVEIRGLMYFIAAKVNVPYENTNPSYGPVISLQRVGKNGKAIRIYKFRTMHPYAEYLQNYVYEQNHLAKGGKLENDFRIAGWGRFLRKTWIDELPQFINFFRGDIKLVGVRALSQHYLTLYPEAFREYRKQFKPGILPPFYVDLPETIEEIVASEMKYIESYKKYGILTDIKYGAIIMYNIIFRGKRSA